MTRFLFTSFFILLLLSCDNSYKRNCRYFHKGKFVSHHVYGENYVITRNDTVQLETNEETGLQLKANIRWVDDCQYELSNVMKKENASDSFQPTMAGQTMTTQLVSANKNYAVYESKWSGVSIKISDTLWKVKNEYSTHIQN